MAINFRGKASLLSFRVSDVDAKAARMRHQVRIWSGVGSVEGGILMRRTIPAAVSQLMLSPATLPMGSCRRHELFHFKADFDDLHE